MKKGFTCSCFDLLHAGHILMLKDAKEQCDYLIVGLQTDPTLDRPEKNKPIQSFKERKIQLEAVKYVDEIFIYETEEDLYKKLLEISPDIRILGSDYIDKPFTGDDLDIPIYFHERKHNYSSTNLRGSIVSEYLHREDKTG
jgi:glycerol-3-phosphate cytidylyltransferase